MIKVTNTPVPSIETFPISCISQVSRDLISDIKDAYPEALTADSANAVLPPVFAENILRKWQSEMNENRFISTSADICNYIDEMIVLAKNGHTMIFTAQ
jgi:hypothetical protein